MDIRLGRRPSPPDPRDHQLSSHASIPPVIPASFTGPAAPVLDQGATPKCVGYSGVLGRLTEERRDEHHTLLFDPDELYARSKALDGDPGGEGTYIRVAAGVLLHVGAKVLASTHANEVGTYKPISAYARLQSIDEIKAAIYLFGSAWLGSVWYDSWFNPVSGMLPAPDSVAGGHAYTAIGYSSKRHAFRCQNSWGPGWSQKGRFWLPYDYVDLTNQNDWEAWRTIDVLGD